MVALLCVSLLAVGAVACDRGDEGGYGASADGPLELPAENETIALDEGDFDVAVTMDVPVGATVTRSTPGSVSVVFDEQAGGFAGPGRLFSLEVQKPNQFTSDLDTVWQRLVDDQSIPTDYEKLEQTDRLLLFTETNQASGITSHGFRMLVEIDGETTLFCRSGTIGGFSEEQVRRQIASCESLAAK